MRICTVLHSKKPDGGMGDVVMTRSKCDGAHMSPGSHEGLADVPDFATALLKFTDTLKQLRKGDLSEAERTALRSLLDELVRLSGGPRNTGASSRRVERRRGLQLEKRIP
jgi:hypothetical protein